MIWINIDMALEIHARQLARYGGGSGLRDMGLLESALTKPVNKHHYESCDSLPELAASYMYGLAKNHPFIDGNKRVAFAVGAVFLSVNGANLKCSDTEAITTILRLATGEVTEIELAGWLKLTTTAPPT